MGKVNYVPVRPKQRMSNKYLDTGASVTYTRYIVFDCQYKFYWRKNDPTLFPSSMSPKTMPAVNLHLINEQREKQPNAFR